jgi:hypothetical protein
METLGQDWEFRQSSSLNAFTVHVVVGVGEIVAEYADTEIGGPTARFLRNSHHSTNLPSEPGFGRKGGSSTCESRTSSLTRK